MGRKELAEHWETLNHMLKKSNSVLERMYSGKNWTGRDFCSIFQSQATAYLNEDWPHEGLTLGTWVKVWQNNSQAKTFLEVFTTFQTCEVGLKLWPLRKPWLQSKQVKHLTANRKVMEGLELRGALWPLVHHSQSGLWHHSISNPTIYLQINFTVFCHKYLMQGLAVLKPSIVAWNHTNSMREIMKFIPQHPKRKEPAWTFSCYQEKKNEHWHWHLLTGRADDSRCSDKTRCTLTSVSASEPEPRRLTHNNMLPVKKKEKKKKSKQKQQASEASQKWFKVSANIAANI